MNPKFCQLLSSFLEHSTEADFEADLIEVLKSVSISFDFPVPAQHRISTEDSHVVFDMVYRHQSAFALLELKYVRKDWTRNDGNFKLMKEGTLMNFEEHLKMANLDQRLAAAVKDKALYLSNLPGVAVFIVAKFDGTFQVASVTTSVGLL